MSIAFAFYVLRLVFLCYMLCSWCVSGQWPFITNK